MKYVVLASSIMMQLCLGGIYAWSVFIPSLKQNFGINSAQAAFIFGTAIGTFTLSMVAAGKLLDDLGPRIVAGIGSALFAAGYILSSLSGGYFPGLLAGIGVVTGAGIGFCYVCPIATCLKWFPEHKGLVVGLTVAGFGGGGILLSSLADFYLGQGMDVLLLFRGIGLSFGAILCITSALMLPPPSSGRRAYSKPLAYAAIINKRKFWILTLCMFAGTFGGLLVIGNLKPMGLAMQVSEGEAVMAVSLFSLGNAAGRILWGALHDRYGQRTIPFSLIALSFSLLTLLWAEPSGVFLPSAGMIGFSFGACFVVYAAELAHWLGLDNVSRFYPLVFLSYGVAGIMGPAFGGFLFDVSGSFIPAALIASLIAFIAVLISITFLYAMPCRNAHESR